jgi:hypothetical protein
MKAFKFVIALLSLLAVTASAQEYSSRYFHYNMYFDAPAPFTITSTTIDGTDSNAISIAGGGAVGATRGAYISLFGNENASDGKILISAGNEVGDGGIYFNTGGVQHFSIPLSTTPLAVITYGLLADSSPGFLVRSQKADGSDDAYIQLTAGGSYSGDRGAGIQLLGNDYGGAATGGTVTISGGGGTTGYIDFWTQVSSNVISSKWTIPVGAATVSDLVAGVSGTASSIATIRFAYADAADTGTLRLVAGGALGTARGASIQLLGNDVGGAGAGAGITAETGTGTLNTFTVNQNGYNKMQLAAMSDADDVTLVLGASSTTLPIFTIRGQTADGDDDGKLLVSAGGDTTVSRGALLTLYGEQEGTGVGGAYLQSSNTVGVVSFSTHGATRFTIADTASSTLPEVIFGRDSYAAMTATLRFDTADGTDDSIMQITGGGSSTVSGTRGAYIQLQGQDVNNTNRGGSINIVGGVGLSSTYYPLISIYNDTVDGSDYGIVKIMSGPTASNVRGAALTLAGNESASAGAVILVAGNVSGGNMRFGANGGDAWTIPYTANALLSDFVAGTTTANQIATLRFAYADAADTGTLKLVAGGAAGTTRGAGITLLGNDVGGAGAGAGMTLEAGTGTAGTIKFDTVGANKWTIAADGPLAPTGVAVASLPGTCTAGALWKSTDSNDCVNGGGDGALCVCNAAGNDWILLLNY